MNSPETSPDNKLEIVTEDGLRAVVNPIGGYVESFQTINGIDLLFPRVDLEKSVRGGVFACAPIFGPGDRAGLPQHGFSRNVTWQSKAGEDSSSVILTHEFTDEIEPELAAYAGCAMEMVIGVESSEDNEAILQTRLTIHNRGSEEFVVAPGFHPYFPVEPGGSAQDITFSTLNADRIRTNRQFNADELKQAQLLGETGTGFMGDFTSNGYNIGLSSNALSQPVIWTDNPDWYVCFEPTAAGPVTSADNTQDLGPYMMQPGETREYFMSIQWIKASQEQEEQFGN